MRSLASKLTIAFLFVGVIGAILVAVFVRQRTQSSFDQLILDQNQQALVTNLTQYYQENGSWNGVEQVFRPTQGLTSSNNREPWPRWEVRRTLFALANSSGTIIYGGGLNDRGRNVTKSDLSKGVPLKVNGDTVGYLLFTPTLDRWNPGTPEANFLTSVNQAIIFSAIGAALIALILGGILAYTMTHSLRELTVATRLLAKGELGHQVKVRSRDELGELATSFNQMSAELAHANDLRRRMTADIAHDLRTPLSVIMGYTEALSDGKLNASPEMYTVMHTEALHLSHLIDDLKTLSLADAGELPLMPQTIGSGELLKRTASAHQVEAEKKNIQLSVDIAPDLPPIQVDVERMAQVLGNLVSNALRYTPAGGGIDLSASAQNGSVFLRVADTGTGIAPEDLPFVFERSFRGDKARTQPNGETGLGLAIAKSLVEAQGGTIEVESTPGQGTAFTIRLASIAKA
jgi:two-component system sensor histidine kinase BaeS